MSDKFLHILKDTANHSVKVKPVSYDFVHANSENPFEKPYDREYWRLTGKKSVIIVTDGEELETYDIIFIKRPSPIITAENITIEEYDDGNVLHSELDPVTHRSIVKEAAKLAFEYTRNVNQ